MHGSIKAAGKSAHWRDEHVKQQMNISRETRGQHKATLLKAVCPSTLSEDRLHPLLYQRQIKVFIFSL